MCKLKLTLPGMARRVSQIPSTEPNKPCVFPFDAVVFRPRLKSAVRDIPKSMWALFCDLSSRKPPPVRQKAKAGPDSDYRRVPCLKLKNPLVASENYRYRPCCKG